MLFFKPGIHPDFIFMWKKAAILLMDMMALCRKFDAQTLYIDFSTNHTTDFKSYRHH